MEKALSIFLLGKDATDYIYRKGFEGAVGEDAVILFVNRQMNQYSYNTIKALRDTFLKDITKQTM